MFSVDVTFSGDTRLLSNIGTAPVESAGVSNVEFFMHQIQCINYGCLHCPVKSVFLHCCDLRCHAQKVKRCVTVHHGVHHDFGGLWLALSRMHIYSRFSLACVW